MINNTYVSKLNSFILGKADQAGTIAELNVSGFDFHTQLDTLLENIVSNRPLPPLIILTGNAGDGKSHIIFKIWLYLMRNRKQARSIEEKISLNSMSDDELQKVLNEFRTNFAGAQAEKIIKIDNYFLVKDASAVEPNELQRLLSRAFRNFHKSSAENKALPTIILSINEGVLRAQLQSLCHTYYEFEPITRQVLKSLEESKEFRPHKEYAKSNSLQSQESLADSVLILNLNTRDIGEQLLESMLDELAQPHHFALQNSACGRCPLNNRCPIRFNIHILGKKGHPARRRLAILFDALNQMGQHITFREALSAIAQTLTGNLSCNELQSAYNALEQPIQLPLSLDDLSSNGIVWKSNTEKSFLLRLLPYLYFNNIFVHSARQKELWEASRMIPLFPIGVRLNEEHLLLNIGLLDPAGYATPQYDVNTTFSSAPLSIYREHENEIQLDRYSSASEEVIDLDNIVFKVIKDFGQYSTNKGIPDSNWLRRLVIASKRQEFFTLPDDKVALHHFPLQHYGDFQSLSVLLKKKALNQIEREIVKSSENKIVTALNQFQQPRTVGTAVGTHLELIQRDHFVLFSRLLATQFELVAATPDPNAYIEQTQIRLRFQQIKTKIFLDCDLLLYEILERFVDGSLSLYGLEPRITEMENFLTKLRSASLTETTNEEYILVGRDITFSVNDGQITVQENS
jgi:hypothetical protein